MAEPNSAVTCSDATTGAVSALVLLDRLDAIRVGDGVEIRQLPEHDSIAKVHQRLDAFERTRGIEPSGYPSDEPCRVTYRRFLHDKG